jgi:hypothetical protein
VTVLCFGTGARSMKNKLTVPFIRWPTPCANLPNSFAPDVFQIGLYCGPEFRGAWQHGAVVLLMMEYACWREHAAVLVGYRCGNFLGRGVCGSMFFCSCDTMETFASLVWLGSAGAVVSGTLGGVMAMGTLGGSAVVGTLGGVTVCMVTIGGVAIILLKSSASLLTADIVPLETLWNGAGGDGLCRIFVRLNAAMMMRSFLCKWWCVAFCWKEFYCI